MNEMCFGESWSQFNHLIGIASEYTQYCFPAYSRRHRQNMDMYLWGGPEVPLEIFNQILISCVHCTTSTYLP